ncbi:transcriptional regulator, DeoR family [Spirosomataceae bacterium TFI 002]|nr:transcriptional regulator, DeoR family [Spirosomataceae bacterium TFI 002]
MRFEARKREIIKQLKLKELVGVGEIATLLGVSDITIRRDFDQLANENLLVRTHGGASQKEEKAFAFSSKEIKNIEAKRIIGEKAAALVQDGDTIFMDCGSTTIQMCPFLHDKKIKIITNSLPVVADMQGSKATINLIGGEIDPERQAIHGKMAEWHIAQYHANKAFIGVDAIDQKNNLWAHSEKEAGNSLAMIASADLVYVLADVSKLEKKSNLRFGELKSGIKLITIE